MSRLLMPRLLMPRLLPIMVLLLLLAVWVLQRPLTAGGGPAAQPEPVRRERSSRDAAAWLRGALFVAVATTASGSAPTARLH